MMLSTQIWELSTPSAGIELRLCRRDSFGLMSLSLRALRLSKVANGF